MNGISEWQLNCSCDQLLNDGLLRTFINSVMRDTPVVDFPVEIGADAALDAVGSLHLEGLDGFLDVDEMCNKVNNLRNGIP